MHDVEIVVLGLLALVAAVAAIERTVTVPYTLLLLIVGIILGFLPYPPPVHLDPEVVFLLFLPPLLYAAALFSSWHDFRVNLKPIASLAVGLVLFTIAVVAAVAHWLIPALPWGAAFVLGAIVAPPDAAAVMAVSQRLGLARPVAIILEGESLLNDATSLVAYRMAVAAVVTGLFSLPQAILEFLAVGSGGLLFGLGIGWLAVWLRQRLDNPPVEITLSLLTPFAAYLPAEQLGLSGVLATVAAGFYFGRKEPKITLPVTRLQEIAIWQTAIFLLNGIIFLLIGLQLPDILDRILQEHSGTALFRWAVLVSTAVIGTRLVWVFAAASLSRLLGRWRGRASQPSWQVPMIIAWAGMRGINSLAAALAIPFALTSGAAFPQRDLIIFLTLCVILVTLLLHGLSLPALMRQFQVAEEEDIRREEIEARITALTAALARLEQLPATEKAPQAMAARLQTEFEYRLQGLKALLDAPQDGIENITSQYLQLRREAIASARNTLIKRRNRGLIKEEVFRRIQDSLDLEEANLERTLSLVASGAAYRHR